MSILHTEAGSDDAAEEAGEEPRVLEHLGLKGVDAAARHGGKLFFVQKLTETVEVGDGDGIGGRQRRVHAIFEAQNGECRGGRRREESTGGIAKQRALGLCLGRVGQFDSSASGFY